jgi:hypothetical protein
MPHGRKDTLQDADQPTVEDRRRHDRVRVVSPELVPLLRDEARRAPEAQVGAPAAAPPEDPLAHYGDPIRGFGIAIAVAIPLWILIVLGVLVFVFPMHR